MKLQPDRNDAVNTVTAYDRSSIAINGELWRQSIILPPLGAPMPWECSDVKELTLQHFEQLLAHAPELVVFGSGPRLQFPHPALLRPLIERGVGVEAMDTAAACRTFNVLVSEGRRVVGALLIGPAT